LLAGECERIGKLLDTELRPVRSDEANLPGANTIVVSVLGLLRRCYG
jgi:hypothetical protein